MTQTTSQEIAFSAKILQLAASPKHRGAFFQDDAKQKKAALLTAKFKDTNFYWLVHPESRVVLAAKFFSYGGKASVASGEWVCSFAENKPIHLGLSLTMTRIEYELRDQPETPSVPGNLEDHFGHLPEIFNLLGKNLDNAIAVAEASLVIEKNKENFEKTTSVVSATESEQLWKSKPLEEQLSIIENILNSEIRQGLNMDGGDLLVLGLEDHGEKLMVQYQGACGGCSSSTGATLSYIESSLRRGTYDGLQVIPQ